MPGLVFNPISNYGAGRGVQPYVPTYDSVYVSSYDLYQASGSQTGGTVGGIVKMDFEGVVDTTWMASANSSSLGTVKEVRFSAGARDSIVADYRITSASVDYRETRLIDKTTGAVSASTGLMADGGGIIYGMSTDTEENYVYVFGQQNLKVTGSATFPASMTRLSHSTLTADDSFNSNIGSGPTSTLGGTVGYIHDVHVNKNGKIGVAHNGTTWNNISNKYANFVVLNQDGTVDTSFDFGSAQFEQLGAPVNNGAVLTCHWFESGSSGVWVVGGKFDEFNNDTTYKKIMAFNEDGSIKTEWYTQFQEFQAGNDLNADVQDITVDTAEPNYGLIIGNFTQKGPSAQCQRIMAITGDEGYPQFLGTGTKPESKEGVIHNSQLYYVYDGTSVQDQSGTTVNVDGMYAMDIFTFDHTSPFDIGAGLETSGGASAEPGSIFLG